jgi:hypothetical protein
MTSRSHIALAVALCTAATGVAAQQAAPTPPQARTVEEQKTVPPPDSRWARLDADADGRISTTEAGKDSAFGLTFDDMDTDDDGFVSSAEYTTFGSATATTSGVSGSTGNAGSFAGLDKDKDGRVSSTEAGANATFDSGFAAMDDNGDGFVTDSEYRAHAQATKQP